MAGRAIAMEHGFRDLLQRIGLEAFGCVLGNFEHPDEQFELGERAEPAVAVDPRDQLVGHFVVDIACGRDGLDDEVAQCLDEEVAPFAGRQGAGVVGGEQLFGFIGADLAVGPAQAPQFKDFLGRNSAVARHIGGQIAEFHAHRNAFPFISLSRRDARTTLKPRYPCGEKPVHFFRLRAETHDARSTSCPSLARRAST